MEHTDITQTLTAGRPRLLVIDDDQGIGDILVDVGQSLHFDVTYSADYVEFLRLVSELRPSIIIVDLQMPGADGITLLRRLGEIQCRSKIILISGMNEKVLRIAETLGRERGLEIAACWTKPFVLPQIRAQLSQFGAIGGGLTADLRDALDQGQIQVWVQPKCHVASGQAVGFEALARWKHPIRGWVPPDVFVPLTERMGWSTLLLERILGATARQLAQWRDRGWPLTAAVNMSARDLEVSDLPDRLAALCTRERVPCDSITLELTESASIETSVELLDVLVRLRVAGFQLSIDDFGIGFSSLSRLRELPFSEIKIDRSFVSRISRERDSAGIVQAIIAMSTNLGLSCVAEGVEDQATAQQLLAWRCALGQGYHYARPLPADAVVDWLAASNSAAQNQVVMNLS